MASKNYEVSNEAGTEDDYVTAETYVDQRALQQVYGIMDNGASSVLVGHNTLLELLHCHHFHGFDVAARGFDRCTRCSTLEVMLQVWPSGAFISQ